MNRALECTALLDADMFESCAADTSPHPFDALRAFGGERERGDWKSLERAVNKERGVT